MKIDVRSKYLIFPVNTFSSVKKLTMLCDECDPYSLDIKLDTVSPNFNAYIDVSRFMGKTLTLAVAPCMEIAFEESDNMDISDYSEHYRPEVHFTTKNGWINDPNGLIYLDGKYHMFYQHNPCENKWGNMHWGHAISDDMIHWEETDVALFPDKSGAMFSGSAIIDERNLSGLEKDGKKAALLFYTATEPFSQYVAYSTDSLKTVKKLGTPVIPFITAKNRDPKVVFCEEWDAYALILFLDANLYALFRGDNLLNWELVQKIELPGDGECPDLFPITADNGKRKWVFIGANDRYLIGDMTDSGFHPTQEVESLHYGKCAYAGQTFSGMPDGRVVRIDWDRWKLSTPMISGQMSFPCELTLKERDGAYRLCSLPIKEIESIYDRSSSLGDFTVGNGETKYIPLEAKPHLIKLKVKPNDETWLTLKIFGIEMTLNGSENTLKISDVTAPASLTSDCWDIVMLVDKCSVELYLDVGSIYLGIVDEKTYCDYNLPYLEIKSDAELLIKDTEIHSLKSIWRK